VAALFVEFYLVFVEVRLWFVAEVTLFGCGHEETAAFARVL